MASGSLPPTHNYSSSISQTHGKGVLFHQLAKHFATTISLVPQSFFDQSEDVLPFQIILHVVYVLYFKSYNPFSLIPLIYVVIILPTKPPLYLKFYYLYFLVPPRKRI